ncbi:MAG: hypothetical protein SF029_23025 [bacterium]|nr:hypothetical protein [bacterium]
MSTFFAILTILSVLYFLGSILLGDLFESAGIEVGDSELSLTVVAAFQAVFGAVGLIGVRADWNLWLTLAIAAASGVLMGRVVMLVLRTVLRQQSTDVTHKADLIGHSGRVTINSPAGTTGEIMVDDGGYVGKLAVKEINDAELQRGDTVEILDEQGGVFLVKKKRG